MIYSIKKKLLFLIKSFGYSLLSLLYRKITQIADPNNHESVEIINTKLENFSYKIYKIKKCRIYTDTINDTAFIVDNKIVDEASFQLRDTKNSAISNNIVFKKGTPRIKKNFNGNVFSLLTGGAGNSNYWHWLFDVLPRIKILKNHNDLKEIDFFLLPDLKKKFQNETLDLLEIPRNKRLSSRIYRHLQTTSSITVDHPYVFNNDPSKSVVNMPDWIVTFLRNEFIGKNDKKFPTKFYIDRSDSTSNHKHLRQIINEDEIKKILSKKGFSIIRLSDLSFSDQVSLFNNASIIVGLHGAGLANLTFCNPATLIIELKSLSAGYMYSNLSKKLKLNYHDISIKPINFNNNDQQGSIEVPLKFLEEKIN